MAKLTRVCLQCRGPISETRPVYLVRDHGGAILGPFHAGCAEHIKIGVEQGKRAIGLDVGELLGSWPTRREETLPE